MTEFQGWLLLAMLAYIAAILGRIGGLPNIPLVFAIISVGFGMVGIVRWLYFQS